MGITIHYRFARSQTPEHLLKHVEAAAREMGMKVVERSWNNLVLHPDPDCECIELRWHKVKNIPQNPWEWIYESFTVKDLGELEPEMWFCSGFTKTQFAGATIHERVEAILRLVSGHCSRAYVSDEANHYECVKNEYNQKKLRREFDAWSHMIDDRVSRLKRRAWPPEHQGEAEAQGQEW